VGVSGGVGGGDARGLPLPVHRLVVRRKKELPRPINRRRVRNAHALHTAWVRVRSDVQQLGVGGVGSSGGTLVGCAGARGVWVREFVVAVVEQHSAAGRVAHGMDVFDFRWNRNLFE
jgi:hypothetical protein